MGYFTSLFHGKENFDIINDDFIMIAVFLTEVFQA